MESLLGKVKLAQLVPPQLKDNGAFANNAYVDTAGFREALVILNVGALDTTIGSTTAAAAVKLEECDTTGGTYTDVDSAALADAVAATEDGKLFAIHLDLTKAHKRYLRINAPTAGDGSTGANMSAIAILGKAEGLVEQSATAMGLTELVTA